MRENSLNQPFLSQILRRIGLERESGPDAINRNIQSKLYKESKQDKRYKGGGIIFS